MTLSSPLTDIKGVGPELAKKLALLGVRTVHDAIHYYPRRYDDFSEVKSISALRPGLVTIRARITTATGRYAGRGMHVTEALATDKTGSTRLVWFNQPYRAASLKRGEEYFISGDFGLRRTRLCITNPSAELVSSFPLNTARIVPIYRETKGLKSGAIRKVIAGLNSQFDKLEESLPGWVITNQKLLGRPAAMRAMHFPASNDELEAARRRLGFEEVFALSLASLLNKQAQQREKGLSIAFDKELAKDFVKHLPFTLTDAQRKTVWRIYQDMQAVHPMNRLVEGDVGSGKTVVAAMAAVMVMKQGFQVSLMAPTELLARQHADTLIELLKPLGMHDKVTLLVGGLKQAQKRRAQESIISGAAGLLVGTHALIQDKVDMHRLGLVIIDEQHRFGVEQRKQLQAKAGHMPHVLSLTATPIPRSLALTLYGELDVSIIDVKPAGRKPIITRIVSPNSRSSLYNDIDKELSAGRQMFVVTPLIADSEALDAKSAEHVYETMRTGAFKHRRIGLLHGKMKAEDKDAVMQRFVAHELDMLVSTTVIEVGVNVPNATVMLIENAERFGLAQMHQLRGRVGRSQQQGYAYLMMGDSSQPSKRLRALESSNDGFKLAELDLELRGPGAIYGTLQHGQLDMRVAKLSDTKLIAAARDAARDFIDKNENLLEYDELAGTVSKLRAVTNLN